MGKITMIYDAALNIPLRSDNVCVVDGDGQIKAEAKIRTEGEDIVADLRVLNFGIWHAMNRGHDGPRT